MKKYAILLSLPILIYISQAALQAKQTLLQQTIEHNNSIYSECMINESWRVHGDAGGSDATGMNNGSGSTGISTGTAQKLTDVERYEKASLCWKSQRKLTPADLYLTVPKKLVDEGKCSISQSEDDHVRPERGGMYATDIACNFKEQGVYAPDYLDDMKEYIIEEVGYDSLLGNFVILSFEHGGEDGGGKLRWYFGHTVLQGGFKKGDTIKTGTRFAKADLSGVTTNYHTHIELRRYIGGDWKDERYVTKNKYRKLEEKRLGGSGSNAKLSGELLNTYYFTSYDLGDVSQNDKSPCISADGKDACALSKTGRGTMALTVDIRQKLGIKFGDKVALTGEPGCEGVYVVNDEMACRFRGPRAWDNGTCTYSDGTPTPRNSNILRPNTPYYIKGDLPGRPGGACQIRKL